MPNYCYNNLTITGDVKSMKELYDFIGPLNPNFTMNNILPMPKEIRNTQSPVRFRAEGTKKVKSISGKTEKVQINKYNQTEQEFLDHRNYLNNKYGYDNWYDWSLANWGCKWDIDNICIDLQSDEKLCVYYLTPWSPNYEFIKYLGSKFQKLRLKLEYYEPGLYFAGVFNVQNDFYEDIDLPLNSVVFAENIEDEYYTFFESYDDYLKVEEKFVDCEVVDIIGSKWEEAISDANPNYIKEKVLNWSAFQEYVKENLNFV